MFKCDDDMVECPYNKSHLMLRKRLQSHLLKCRVHYPDVELMKCPFNATHLVPEPEFAHHVTSCPDRKLITQYKYDAPEQKEEEAPSHAPVESEENWDETDVPDYDPTKYAETATVLRRPEGPTPSERKEFMKKERKRLGDADTDDEDNVVESTHSEHNGVGRRDRSSRSRSPRSLSPRSRSPFERNSFTASTSREHRTRNPSPPPPPIFRIDSVRDKERYNISSDRSQSRDERSQRSHNYKDSYSSFDQNAYDRRSRDHHNKYSRNSEYRRSSPAGQSQNSNNYKHRQ